MLLLFLPAVLLSCAGVEQYRAGIEALSTDWTAATASVTELASNITSSLSDYSKMAGQYKLSDDVLAKLKPDQKSTWETAQNDFVQSLQGFAPIRTEIAEFTKTWGEESTKVQALTDGLASGKLEGDVNTQVNDLNTLIAQAKDKVTAWQSAYDAAKTKTEAALDNMKSVFASLSAPATAK